MTLHEQLPEKFPSDSVLPMLQTISALIEKRCHRFLTREYGLTMPQYMLLLAATGGDAATLGALADELNCSRGNLTGVADRLERDGWLVRERSTEDRRVVNIRLTEKGTQVDQIRGAVTRELNQLSKIWSNEECSLLHRCLDRLYGGLRSEQSRQGKPDTQQAS